MQERDLGDPGEIAMLWTNAPDALLCCASACGSKEGFLFLAYPAFRFAQSGINPRPTHFLERALRTSEAVPGYYQAVPGGTDPGKAGCIVAALRKGWKIMAMKHILVRAAV
jgi:hypothetical protein